MVHTQYFLAKKGSVVVKYYFNECQYVRELTTLKHLQAMNNEGGEHIVTMLEDHKSCKKRRIPGISLSLGSVTMSIGEIMERNDVTVPPAELQNLAREILMSIDWIHSRNVLHLGIRPDCIYNVSGHWKLSNFTNSILMSESVSFGRISHEYAYWPCETSENVHPTTHYDLWAFGVSMFEIATKNSFGKYVSENPKMTKRTLFAGLERQLNDWYPGFGTFLMRSALIPNMTVQELLRDEWLS